MASIDTLESGPSAGAARLILAHGAGGPMDSAFFETFVEILAVRGIASTRFEFGYMAARRIGKKRPPPRAETLVREYGSVVDQVRESLRAGQRLFIGGKSMGGRVASMFADEGYKAGLISGLVCLGYPFHPPKKPEQLRTAHLLEMKCPALIIQGDRDPFGKRAEVEALTLSPSISIHWVGDGDHDLGPRGASGFTRRGNLEAAADRIAVFMVA